MSHRILLVAPLLLLFAACKDQNAARRDSARHVLLAETVAQQGAPIVTPTQDSLVSPVTAPQQRVAPKPLSPAAQAVAEQLVFVPRNRSWFLIAVRARRLLVDIGRIDMATPKDSTERLAFHEAFREAALRNSPIHIGSTLRVYGPWGNEIASIASFDVWNGRIVGVLKLSHTLEALVRKQSLLQGSAVRVDTVQLALRDSIVRDSLARDSVARAALPVDTAARARAAADSIRRDSIMVATRCVRDSVPVDIAERVLFVRDSLERWLADSVKAPYQRVETREKTSSFAVSGCFGVGRVLVLAARRDPDVEFSAERAVILGDSGRVVRLRIADLRFRVHEPLSVFDADGDGIDDVATRALGERSGGLTIMRLDTIGKRMQRLAAGFTWETK